MVKYIVLNKNEISVQQGTDFIKGDIIWIDLINPTDEERAQVEEYFDVDLFTPQESEEIESSSKYVESDNNIGINLNFLRLRDGNYINEPVSFILKGKILITQRGGEYRTFYDTYLKITSVRPSNGIDIFLALLEIRIDFDADLIENITDQIGEISKELVREDNPQRKLLIRITSLQESTISIRENIVEKQRILSSILKSKFFPKANYEILRVMIKDVSSLLDHTSFNFERLEFLQNSFLGLLDMEQNRAIKIFTIVTVVFMPPTLIASVYGMNFDFMPELDEKWGYWYALGLMLFSSGLTLFFFKRKKWL